MKIKGKRLTIAQHNLLKANGFDSKLYLYLKTSVYNRGEENNKKAGQRLTQGTSKVEYQIFVHRETGEEIKCEIRKVGNGR